MPSMNDSSDPVETSSTRTLAVGRSASRRASSSSDTTPVALSFAPGTTCVEPICADHGRGAGGDDAAGDPARPGCPASEPSAASAGPPKTGNISGGLVSLRSISAGNRRHTKAGIAGWKIRPDFAASWWATSTTVRRASAGPISATTLKVSRLGSSRRA